MKGAGPASLTFAPATATAPTLRRLPGPSYTSAKVWRPEPPPPPPRRPRNDPAPPSLLLHALRLGVDGNALFRWQDEARRRTGKWVSLDEILDEYEALG